MSFANVAATRERMKAIIQGVGYTCEERVNKAHADLTDKQNLDRTTYVAICGADIPVPSVAPDSFTILIVFYFDRSLTDLLQCDDTIDAVKTLLLVGGSYNALNLEMVPTVIVVDHPKLVINTGDRQRVSYNMFCYS